MCSTPDCENPPAAGQRYCLPCKARYMRGWRRTHRPTKAQRRKANCRSYLHTYIKRGQVAKGSCAICGTRERIEAHHEDYSKPLDVVWLCRGHHVMLTRGLLTLPKAA